MPTPQVWILNCSKWRNWTREIWLLFLSGTCCDDNTQIEEQDISFSLLGVDLGLNSKHTLPSSFLSSERGHMVCSGTDLLRISLKSLRVTYDWFTSFSPSRKLSFSWTYIFLLSESSIKVTRSLSRSRLPLEACLTASVTPSLPLALLWNEYLHLS